MKQMSVIIFLFYCGEQARGQTPAESNSFFAKRNFLKTKTDSLEESIDRVSQLRLQTGYQNKVLFAGRNFGVNQFGTTLSATYHHRSGLNLEYEGNYWSEETPHPYALTETGVYFEKAIAENYYITPGYWRLFFHNGSEEERNLFTNFFLLDQSWYTSPGIFGLTYYFIKGTETAHRLDISFTKSVDFYHLLSADKLSLEPSFTATLSSVNYLIFLSGTDESVVEDPSAFKIGNYEFVLPLVYRRFGKLELNFAWHYTTPVSVSPEENLAPISYFTFEMMRTFMIKQTNRK